ncbi:MAG: 2-amino-4-hydroxy-6-hydroxymethyldihydropteridine diphosphokinase [Candidatus Omnitrophica bacterium]|nr:2-amino-4-hydroxy-6-hydroxymethyldihydropteridine diphosphokinase [Candidatus Omnitrophota bacterium]
MKTVYLSVGSNICPQENIPSCLRILKKKFWVKKISSVYETAPIGPAGTSKFWNLAVSIRTRLKKKDLEGQLRSIEKKLLRLRHPANKFAPRTIDLDILPEPDYQHKAFVIIPLSEIAPDEVDPGSGKTFKELAQAWNRNSKRIRKIDCKNRRRHRLL